MLKKSFLLLLIFIIHYRVGYCQVELNWNKKQIADYMDSHTYLKIDEKDGQSIGKPTALVQSFTSIIDDPFYIWVVIASQRCLYIKYEFKKAEKRKEMLSWYVNQYDLKNNQNGNWVGRIHSHVKARYSSDDKGYILEIYLD